MFKQARIKLTIWYLLIIMTISLFFSALVYRNVTIELERGYHRAALQQKAEELGIGLPRNMPQRMDNLDPRLENFIMREILQEDLVAAKKRVFLTLLTLNGFILTFSTLAGYVLAGITLKPIKNAMNQQKRFVADASHELRTPLTSLKTSIEVALRDKKLNLKTAKNTLKESLADINNLESLTNNLLKLANHSSSQKKYLFSQVNLKKVVGQAVRKVQALARAKKITIHTSKVKNYSINADEASIIELVTILVDNAIKYGKKGGWIKLSTKSNKKSVILTVVDNGIGIDKKDLNRIFDRFYRADQARNKTNTDGFGLGLSVAKKIIRLHHGNIEVVSKINKGTSFMVKLPTVNN